MSHEGIERLWTPWRLQYVTAAAADRPTGCVLCALPRADDEREVLVLARGAHTYVVLNAYPYNPGHLMVVPQRHVGEYTELTEGELAETTAFVGTAITALRAVSSPHGFNVGMNLGRVAGAGIADHVHTHVVPRWGGDTNFMPVVGETKVMPELLAQTWEKLRPQFDAARPPG